MKSSKPSIDIELLRKYYNDTLSNVARNDLEKTALNDPFLKDAMDGFDENPGSFNAFYNKHKTKLKPRRNYTLLIAMSVLAFMFAITAFINSLENPNRTIAVLNDTTVINIEKQTISEEFEIVAEAIDTLELITASEIISAEVVAHRQEVVIYQQEHAVEGKDSLKPEDSILIDEPITTEEDFTIIAENTHKLGQATSPTSYLYDLLIVDYREIKRSKKSISYLRHELSGVSADMEDYTIEENQSDLIERQVNVSYIEYLDKSMYYFSKGKFKQALNRYLTILEQYPKDLNASFYGGLSYYNLGEYEKSITFFDSILQSEIHTFNEEALWYKAKSLIQLGLKPTAKEVLNIIISGGGFYTKDAILLQEKL